ncbi:MAG: GDP-mannose 4,6-dehydratase [Terriglobales bacterium]
MNTALITGVNGQDGSYLAELLLGRGYRVAGTVREASSLARIEHLGSRVEIVRFDLAHGREIENLLRQFQPAEFYNLAARASSSELWTDAALTGEVNGLAVARILEAIRAVNPAIRFCQASSSEIFGEPVEVPQSETTPLRPRNPYGAAKAYAQWITAQYREKYSLFACSAILFNHESPRRGLEFVPRKICRTAAAISLGLERELRLGDLDACRDWGFAGDYVDALWRMLQQAEPDDYVIASGESHSVRQLCEIAFACVNLDFRQYVVQDSSHHRFHDTSRRRGNPAKAAGALGWKPSVTFEQLVGMMVEADLRLLEISKAQVASESQ